MAQTGLFDLSDRYASLDAKRDPLVEIDAIVPWEVRRYHVSDAALHDSQAVDHLLMHPRGSVTAMA
jgi:hypothetical protein